MQQRLVALTNQGLSLLDCPYFLSIRLLSQFEECKQWRIVKMQQHQRLGQNFQFLPCQQLLVQAKQSDTRGGEQPAKKVDRARNKTRVNIGLAFGRWQNHWNFRGLKLDSEVATFLYPGDLVFFLLPIK